MSRGDPTYWRVSPKFWRHAREYEWSDDTRHLAMYLLTCEHRTTEGLYFLPVGYMATDLTWAVSRVTATLTQTLAHGFVQYDHRASVVFLPKAMKYQRPDNPNQQTSAVRRVLELPKTCLFAAFLEAAHLYAQAFAQALQQALPQGYTYPTATTTATTKDQDILSDSGESNDIEAPPLDTSPDDFDLFWTPYPRKESKKAAQSRWRRVAKKDRAAAVAAAEAMAECVTRGWQEKTFCPHPSTFLNQRRWEDWADGPPANYLPDEAKSGNGNGPAVVKRPTCPKCEADLTYDDRQHATCPMCDYREVPA